MPDIRMPDGQVVRFPDTMSQTQISGLIASKYPREVGEANAAVPGAERDTSGGFAFDGSNVPGYDPQSGIVAGGAIDDDLGQEYGIGIRRGLEALAGLPGDIGPMGGNIASFLAGKAGAEPETQETIRNVASRITPFPLSPGTEDVRALTNPVLGTPDDPLTREGQAARTTGEFGAGALGPGGPVRKALQVALPAAGSEIGGYLAEDTPYEPYARLAGGVLGGGLSALKMGAKPIAEAASDLGTKAKDLTRIIKRMQQDGMTPQQIQARLAELGPDATLMDVGPNLRQEGQRIFAKGGRGRGIIDETLTPRDQGANARIRADVDANFGPASPPSYIDRGLKRAQRSLGPEYEAVLGNAKAVNVEAIANDIQSMIANTRGEARSALEKVRDMLRIEGTDVLDPHPRAALATRQAIDGMVKNTNDTNVQRILGDFRKRLDNELASAVPNIKAVDQKYARLSKQREAVERGQTVLRGGDNPIWPQELADDIAKGGPVIQGRLAQGARANIETKLRTKSNDRVALRDAVKGEGDFNQEKLTQLYGPDKTGRVYSTLDREATFADTSNRVMKNSATAERLPEGGGSSGVREAFMAGGPKSLAYSGLVRGVEAAVDKIRGAAAASRDERVARILSSTDANRIATALLKANGGKPLPAERIENAVRTLLLTSGATAKDR